MVTVRFNDERAREVFAELTELWQSRTGPFKNYVLPQEHYRVEQKALPLSRWLLGCATFMRGGEDSDMPFRPLIDLKDRYPALFDPHAVHKKWSVEEVEQAFLEANVSLYKRGEHARSWHHNFSSLAQGFGGDVRGVFSGTSEFEEAFARIDYKKKGVPFTFRGMRRKIFSLYTIWLQECEIIPIFPTPLPVDFHALRILWATGVIEFDGVTALVPTSRRTLVQYPKELIGLPAIRVNERIINEITWWSQRFLQESGFSHLVVNPALWVYSRMMCAHAYQNALIEPSYKNYHDPCACCSLAKYCSRAIPSHPYYKFGVLMSKPRKPYPYPSFPFVQDLTFRGKKGIYSDSKLM